MMRHADTSGRGIRAVTGGKRPKAGKIVARIDQDLKAAQAAKKPYAWRYETKTEGGESE